MKKNRFLFLVVLLVLILSMVACSAGSKEKTEAASEPVTATEAAEAEVATTEPPAAEAESTVKTDFPMLPDAENVNDMAGTIMYQTATSMKDTFDFYKKELSAQGLKENEILTLNDEAVSQLVFTGSENGKSLIVQMTKLSETSIAVTIRYE